MKVWIGEEKRYIDVGTKQWAITWWTLRPEARGKEEPDFETDLEENVVARKDRETAEKLAKNVARHSYFGVATLQEQRAGRVEGSYGEWQDVGRSEEVVE
jgi:hypothetical protein